MSFLPSSCDLFFALTYPVRDLVEPGSTGEAAGNVVTMQNLVVFFNSLLFYTEGSVFLMKVTCDHPCTCVPCGFILPLFLLSSAHVLFPFEPNSKNAAERSPTVALDACSHWGKGTKRTKTPAFHYSKHLPVTQYVKHLLLLLCRRMVLQWFKCRTPLLPLASPRICTTRLS